MIDELVIFDDVVQTTKENITIVIDDFFNFNRNSIMGYLDSMMKAPQSDTRTLYVTHVGNGPLIYRSETIGYIDLIPIENLPIDAVKVRIVCLLPTQYEHWRFLAQNLEWTFQMLDIKEVLETRRGKPGRPSDPFYDEAFISVYLSKNKVPKKKAYEVYCKQKGIDEDDLAWEAFLAAMRRGLKKLKTKYRQNNT